MINLLRCIRIGIRCYLFYFYHNDIHWLVTVQHWVGIHLSVCVCVCVGDEHRHNCFTWLNPLDALPARLPVPPFWPFNENKWSLADSKVRKNIMSILKSWQGKLKAQFLRAGRFQFSSLFSWRGSTGSDNISERRLFNVCIQTSLRMCCYPYTNVWLWSNCSCTIEYNRTTCWLRTALQF